MLLRSVTDIQSAVSPKHTDGEIVEIVAFEQI